MSAPRRLLDTLPVASLLIYPSRPQTAADREARSVVVSGIKQGRPNHVQRVALRLSQMAPEDPVRRVNPAEAVLVPVPRSAPLSTGSRRPALELANALLAAGVGAGALRGDRRDARVDAAGEQPREQRLVAEVAGLRVSGGQELRAAWRWVRAQRSSPSQVRTARSAIRTSGHRSRPAATARTSAMPVRCSETNSGVW